MFNARCKYALRALTELVTILPLEKKIGAEELASRLDIPKPFLSKILQELVRGNYVLSIKGPGGGFILNEDHLNDSILDFLSNQDCLSSIKSCVLGLGGCSDQQPCSMHAPYKIFREEFLANLNEVKILDLPTTGEIGL